MVNELVPVEALTRRTDRFHCAALKAALSAATCITRHTAGQHTESPSKQG